MDTTWHIPQRCGAIRQTVQRVVESSTSSARYSVYANHRKQSYDCTCPGFRFHGKCKHVEAAKAEVCRWSSETGPEQSLQQNVNCVCPVCSGETELLEVA